jgi:DNA polymerase III subunit delta'
MELSGLTPISAPFAWQSPLWNTLQQQIEAEKLPHALLLSGMPGIGKGHMALALARRLLCAQPAEGLNCGSCHACELSAAGTHGDFKWLQPEEKSRTIKIEQVRGAIAFSHETASFGANKVLVFSPADAMNNAAYNAILKSLEEPSENTFILLVCDSLHGIPATIRSRCQLLRVPVPAREESIAWLHTVTGDDKASEELLSLTEDRPLQAAELYAGDLGETYAERKVALRAFLNGQITLPQITAAWGDQEPLEFLKMYTSELRLFLKTLSTDDLAGAKGRGAFALLDQAQGIQRATEAGSNPGKQMLLDLLLSKSHSQLGREPHSDKI